MATADFRDLKNLTPQEFEGLADYVGPFVIDQRELRSVLDTASQAAKETEVYKNLQGIYLRREILGIV